MKERLVQTWRNFVTSFTILMICYLVFLKFGLFEELNTLLVERLLSICAAVTLTQLATSYLPVHSFSLQLFISFVDMVVVVFFMGIVAYRIIEPTGVMVLAISGLLLLIFGGTVLITYLADYKRIMEINEIIKHRKK